MADTVQASFLVKQITSADGPSGSSATTIWSSGPPEAPFTPPQPELARFAITIVSDISSDSNGVKAQVTFDDGVTWQTIKQATYTASSTAVTPIEFDRVGDRMRVTFTSASGGTQTVFKGEVRAWHVRAVGDVTVNTGSITVSNVTVTELIPGVGATDMGKAEDAVAGDGDTGIAMLAVRRDTAASGVSATGDYATLNVDSLGRLRVGADTGAASIAKAEDAAAADGDTAVPVLFVRRDSASSGVSADGDYASPSVDANGLVRVNASGVAVPVTDNSGSLTVDSAQLPAALGQTTMSASLAVTLASNQSALPVTDNSGSLTVDNAGTFAIQDSQKVVDNAAFTDGTTPVQPAGFILDETAGTALTENDAGAARMDSKRAQVIVIEDATTRGRRATVSSGGAQLVDASAAAVPIKPGNKATFGFGFQGTAVSSGTAATTTIQLFTIFGNGSQTVATELMSLDITWASGAGGSSCFITVKRITAENGTPGGTSLTPVPTNGGTHDSTNITLRRNPAAPTAATGSVAEAVITVATAGSFHFDLSQVFDGQPPTIRASTAEGYSVTLTTTGTGPTTAADCCVSGQINEA